MAAVSTDPIVDTIDTMGRVSCLLVTRGSFRPVVPAAIVLHAHNIVPPIQQSQDVAAIAPWAPCQRDRVAMRIAAHADRVPDEQDVFVLRTERRGRLAREMLHWWRACAAG